MKSLKSKSQANPRLLRWCLSVQEMLENIEFHFISSQNNTVADSLSRDNFQGEAKVSEEDLEWIDVDQVLGLIMEDDNEDDELKEYAQWTDRNEYDDLQAFDMVENGIEGVSHENNETGIVQDVRALQKEATDNKASDSEAKAVQNNNRACTMQDVSARQGSKMNNATHVLNNDFKTETRA